MVKYSSGFIGGFKLGDNIVHNLDILNLLYATQKTSSPEQAELLRKPIIVWCGAVAEALLYDLYETKIPKFTSEGVPNVPKIVLKRIRLQTVDQFGRYIANARRFSLLGPSPDLYNSLEELRKLRNRIHIQNKKGDFETDEPIAFSSQRQAEAERTLEQLISYMSSNHLRQPSRHFVADFILPWDSRLESNP
jgi:hypothetical protein